MEDLDVEDDKCHIDVISCWSITVTGTYIDALISMPHVSNQLHRLQCSYVAIVIFEAVAIYTQLRSIIQLHSSSISTGFQFYLTKCKYVAIEQHLSKMLRVVCVCLCVCVCVCVCACVHACVRVCVCVVALRLSITSGVIWTPYDWWDKFYSFYKAAIVSIVSKCGLSIDEHCRNQPNQSKLLLYKLLLSL